MRRRENVSSLHNLILHRTSTGAKYLTEPAPGEAVLTRAVTCALRAPCHDADFPVRFVRIDSRERLADLFEARLPTEASPEERAKARSKATKGPGLFALVMRRTSGNARLERENLMTAGAALMNFLLSLEADGFAAKTVSAPEFEDPKGLYDPGTESLLAFVLCGTPRDNRPEVSVDEVDWIGHW